MRVEVESNPLFDILSADTSKSNVSLFFAKLFESLAASGIEVLDYEIDHLCWRCSTEQEYISVGKAVSSIGADLLVEGMIGGRPIATFKLNKPVALLIDGRRKEINCLEIPAPKPNRPYISGFEHVECVVGDLSSTPYDPTPVLAFRDKFSNHNWNTEALTKECNADISLSFDQNREEYPQNIVVKFHAVSLDKVIEYEKREGGVVSVPEGYPSISRVLGIE
jgi:uncharacterized protein